MLLPQVFSAYRLQSLIGLDPYAAFLVKEVVHVFSAYRLQSLIGPIPWMPNSLRTFAAVFSAYRLQSLIGPLFAGIKRFAYSGGSSAPIGFSR